MSISGLGISQLRAICGQVAFFSGLTVQFLWAPIIPRASLFSYLF